MPCDVIIGKGALNFPCEIPDRGHDGPHSTPSILASVQARQAWERQQAARAAQPGPGLPYQNYEQFGDGVQKPHPRQLTQCFFCPVQVAYEDFYGHIASHAGQGSPQAPTAPQTAAWEPQGPPPGTPAPTPSGVVGATSADALAQHIAQHPRSQPPVQPVPQFSPVYEQAAHMAEVMDYGTHEGQAGYAQQLPSMPYGGDRVMHHNGEAPNLWDEVQAALNRHSRENNSNTPDFILAQFLASALEAYEQAVNSRDNWYSISQSPGQGPTS
jgi:hypothetical protein